MTLTPVYLEAMCTALNVSPSREQKKALLEYYGNDPDENHVWSEQDIYQQVRKKLIGKSKP